MLLRIELSVLSCIMNLAFLDIDDDESGRFFDRSAYSRMMDDVENGKIGVCPLA